MKSIAIAKFKAQCLSLIEHLEKDGLVITKHGRPVARVVPFERASADRIGSLKGRIRVLGDIFGTDTTWDAGAEP